MKKTFVPIFLCFLLVCVFFFQGGLMTAEATVPEQASLRIEFLKATE